MAYARRTKTSSFSKAAWERRCFLSLFLPSLEYFWYYCGQLVLLPPNPNAASLARVICAALDIGQIALGKIVHKAVVFRQTAVLLVALALTHPRVLKLPAMHVMMGKLHLLQATRAYHAQLVLLQM